MNEIDLKLKLLAGEPFDIEGAGKIYPPKLRDIMNVGFEKFSKMVYLFTLDPYEFIDKTKLPPGLVLTGLDLIIASEDKDLIELLSEALKFFFKVDKVIFSYHYQCFFLGDIQKNIKETPKVNKDNYDAVREFVLYQTGLKNPYGDQSKYNPANEKAKEIVEKLKKAKEKMKKVQGEDEAFDIADIISAITAKSNSINKFNVWDLTLFQIYDEYRRIEMIDQYDISLQSIMHGADPDKVQLKHWASRITLD